MAVEDYIREPHGQPAPWPLEMLALTFSTFTGQYHTWPLPDRPLHENAPILKILDIIRAFREILQKSRDHWTAQEMHWYRAMMEKPTYVPINDL